MGSIGFYGESCSLRALTEGDLIQDNISTGNGRLNFPVDLVRVVAIVFVLMYHVANEGYAELNFSPWGYFTFWWTTTVVLSFVVLGVPLFVMLSGGLLLQPQKAEEPIKVFLKKRLSRIGVAFLFWSAIYFAWDYFANGIQLTPTSIVQSLLEGGAYKQFWFIYLIIGLYLVTPVLRVIVAHADRKVLRYFIILWFAAATLAPLFHLITGFELDGNLFAVGGFMGYFVLGIYLLSVNLEVKTLKWLFVVGVVMTVAGTYLMNFAYTSMGQYNYFLYITSGNVVLAAATLYMLLGKQPPDWPGNKHPHLQSLIKQISANTLPVFFFHVIIIEAFNKGLLGIRISFFNLPAPIEIPLLTTISLFVTLGLVLAMKRIPILRTLIG